MKHSNKCKKDGSGNTVFNSGNLKMCIWLTPGIFFNEQPLPKSSFLLNSLRYEET